jgi:hypothetical protein
MERISPLRLAWLKAYLNEGGPTFLNATASAIAAGYKAKRRGTFRQIGYLNRIRLERKIAQWLHEAGLSETRLKTKVLELMEARETKFEKIKGAVLESNLPDGCRVMATSGTVSLVKGDGEMRRAYSDGDSLIAIDIIALETQRKTLDMALKMKGLYAPEKHEHTGTVVTVLKLPEDEKKLLTDMVTVGIQRLMLEGWYEPLPSLPAESLSVSQQTMGGPEIAEREIKEGLKDALETLPKPVSTKVSRKDRNAKANRQKAGNGTARSRRKRD